MPEELATALADLRPLLTGPDLVRAVASGARRGARPRWSRVELRRVGLRGGERTQVSRTVAGGAPTVVNLGSEDAEATVTELLAEGFGSWYVRAGDRVVQLRVTKKGQAQVHLEQAPPAPDGPVGHDRVAQHLLPPDDPVLAALGADADKRRQVDAFLRQLAAATRSLREACATEHRPLRVVDLGCGNAYLTFAAHHWLARQCPDGVLTSGVDVRDDVIARNRELLGRLDLPGLDFVRSGIREAQLPDSPDVVLALHACDTATDDALALAVRAGARVVLAAPCCHHDVQAQIQRAQAQGRTAPEPYQALVRHPILRERFADVLTDAVRADLLRLHGYRVEVVEFIDSRHTPRNALIRARWTGAPATERRRAEYAELVAAWNLQPALARRLAAGEQDRPG